MTSSQNPWPQAVHSLLPALFQTTSGHLLVTAHTEEMVQVSHLMRHLSQKRYFFNKQTHIYRHRQIHREAHRHTQVQGNVKQPLLNMDYPTSGCIYKHIYLIEATGFSLGNIEVSAPDEAPNNT